MAIGAPFVKSSLTYWENKCYEGYLLSDSITILNNHHFLVGLKKCGRVTTTRITNKWILVFKFFKATKGAWWMPWV